MFAERTACSYIPRMVHTSQGWFIHPKDGSYIPRMVHPSQGWFIHPKDGSSIPRMVHPSQGWFIHPKDGSYVPRMVHTSQGWFILELVSQLTIGWILVKPLHKGWAKKVYFFSLQSSYIWCWTIFIKFGLKGSKMLKYDPQEKCIAHPCFRPFTVNWHFW